MPELIVAGFHRSGTSLLAELLSRAGLYVGSNLLGAKASNPYGHFEDVEVMRLHERMLADNGLSWHVDRPFVPWISPSAWRQMESIAERREAAHRLWGFKDPRACLFLPAWKYLRPGMRVVLLYRHYAEATYSLERRQAEELFRERGPTPLHRLFWKQPDHALRMWLAYNRAALDFADAYPDDVAVVGFEHLRDGLPICEALNRRWDLGLEQLPTYEVFDPAVTGRRPGRQPACRLETVQAVRAMWSRLEGLAASTVAVAGGIDG